MAKKSRLGTLLVGRRHTAVSPSKARGRTQSNRAQQSPDNTGNANQCRENNERSQPKHIIHWTPVQPQAEHHQTNSRKDTECIETGDTPIKEQHDNTQIFGCSGRNSHGCHEKQCELARTATAIDELCSSGRQQQFTQAQKIEQTQSMGYECAQRAVQNQQHQLATSVNDMHAIP